jgi:hypothetical protein
MRVHEHRVKWENTGYPGEQHTVVSVPGLMIQSVGDKTTTYHRASSGRKATICHENPEEIVLILATMHGLVWKERRYASETYDTALDRALRYVANA